MGEPLTHTTSKAATIGAAGGGAVTTNHHGAAPHRALQHVHDTPWLKPALQATVVSDKRTGRLQMLTQGNLPYVLANCSDYWDGTTLFPLTAARRTTLLQTYQQMRAEDLSCAAIAYDPVSIQEAALFRLLDSAAATSSDVPGAPASPAPVMTTSDVGLGFDDRRVFLLAREGDMRLNAQVDARMNAKHNDHLFSKFQALLSAAGGGAPALPSEANHQRLPSSSSAEAKTVSLAALVEARMMRMLSGQIFVGLVASRVQPKSKMQNTIKDLDRSGIRFVFMSHRRLGGLKCSRTISAFSRINLIYLYSSQL
jgi:hypothetical protein